MSLNNQYKENTINRLTLSETDTFEEVNKALNMLIDNHNENEVYNAEVERYNESVIPKKKDKKKGGK